MTARSVASEVTVSVDPATAFSVFTEELECWWLQGAINFFDSTRAFSKRMEPGVGGRILEVYDEATGDGLEVARITAWEPGARLAWSSSIDDVETEVRFEKVDLGTLVTVTATVLDGGADRGGSAFARVVPIWLPRWVERRDRAEHVPHAQSRLAVAVHPADPGGLARWLRDVLGLEPVSAVPEPGVVLDGATTWLELRIGDASVVVRPRADAGTAGNSVTPWVFVDDLDAHFARVTAAGAQIVERIWHHGVRAYAVADPEGTTWTVAQATPRMRRAPAGP